MRDAWDGKAEERDEGKVKVELVYFLNGKLGG